MSKLVAFLKNNSGATAIEYGLIAAVVNNEVDRPRIIRKPLPA